MSSNGKKDGPSGQDAINEIGERLKDLLGGVMGAFQGKASSGGSESTIETDKGPIKTQMGWSVKFGGLELNGSDLNELQSRAPYRRGQHPGAARTRPQGGGGTRPRAPAPSEPEAAPAPRAAHVEIFDEADAVIVTAELPGVSADQVAIDLQGSTLSIRAAGARPFEATAQTPESVDPAAEPEMRLANGVLEIRLSKKAAD